MSDLRWLRLACGRVLLLASALMLPTGLTAALPEAFIEQYCTNCHDADTRKGDLDITSLKPEYSDAEIFAKWVRIHDRIESGDMPPRKEKQRPSEVDAKAAAATLASSLIEAEHAQLSEADRTGIRRLTRAEYENTVRDLFEMPGIGLQSLLTADGNAHGFDNNCDALDVSHASLSKYIEAADKALDQAIAVQPSAPKVKTVRLSLARTAETDYAVMHGDAMLLRDGKTDPDFPPPDKYSHINLAAHAGLGMFEQVSSVGVFRHEDGAWFAIFRRFAALHPGRYRVKTSVWSLGWDKGQIRPSRGIEAARFSIVQFSGDGRSGPYPSSLIGYYDAPSLHPAEHSAEVWLNEKESFGFNAASLAPVTIFDYPGHAMGYTGPCVVSDWLEVEGPINDAWPPASHRLLFGDLPLKEFQPLAHKDARPPPRKELIQEISSADNKPEPVAGLWTPQSTAPLEDANRLLANFLPKAFRRPVDAETRRTYVAMVEARLQAGDCFETAMRRAYRAALCSLNFLYHVEPPGRLDDYALASRLSYWLWNSMPDDELIKLAGSGKLREPGVLSQQMERLLKDPRSERFINDFLGQWLKLRSIAANDPDPSLYPEFSPYLQDSMLAESRAYFRVLIEQNLDAGYLVDSDFAMLNEKLATFYGIPGVTGTSIRRVKLPTGSPRGGFLTQGAVLKVTANGTTTSPVPRGVFVMARLLGSPPEPPPSNVPAVEPDVQGATTIREMLDKHRTNATCAACHAKIDPPGFALESFDVIGGYRDRYRSLNAQGEKPQRGSIDPNIPIKFTLGPKVDAAGSFADGTTFRDVYEFKKVIGAQKHRLLLNLAHQLLVYATGREVAFADRPELNDLVVRTANQGGGIRTLLIEIAASKLFQTR